MNLHRIRRVLLGTAVVAGLTAAVAVAATIQTYSQKFTVKSAGKSTGMIFSASARDPSAVGQAPTPAKRVVLTFPAGTRINSAALPRCGTPSSCPASSKLGTGKATVLLGAVRLPLTASVYNRSGGLLIVILNPADPAHPVVLKPTLSASRLTLDIPALSVGRVRAVVAALSVSLGKVGSGSKAYATTPGTCPASHAWTFRALFSYEDGKSKSLTSSSPCSRT